MFSTRTRATVGLVATSAMVFGGLFLVAPASAVSSEDGSETAASTGEVVTSSTGTIIVRKGGARLSDGTVKGLAGAKFVAYAANQTEAGTCTTDDTGTCPINVTFEGTSADFRVVEDPATPTGWSAIPQLSVGSGNGNGSATDYDFTVTVENGQSAVAVPPTDTNTNRTWANAAANPEWPGFCGINVALLLDVSGSIDTSEWAQMKTAAGGFVTALKGTPSQVSVWSFASKANGEATAGLQPVKSDLQAAAVISTINGVDKTNGGTNWDEGIAQIAFAKQAQPLDAVLVLTDGNPTYSRNGGNGSDVILQNVEEAVHSANAVKALPSTPRMIGVGIGISGDAALNLAAISGPNVEGQDPSYYTTDFAALGTTLRNIAASQCAGTVTVEKRVTTTDEGPGTPANGWQFGFGVTPDDGTKVLTPADGITGEVNKAQGVVQYQVTGGTWPKTVTITETQQADTSLLSGTCTINPGVQPKPTATERVTTFTNDGNVVTVRGLEEQESVTCTFLNKVPTPPPPPPPTCTNCTPPPPPVTPPVVETPTVAEPAVVAPAEVVESVSVAAAATVPEAEAPATVSVPEAATVPESVPAGDGPQAPALPMWVTALLIASMMGLATVAVRRMGLVKG